MSYMWILPKHTGKLIMPIITQQTQQSELKIFIRKWHNGCYSNIYLPEWVWHKIPLTDPKDTKFLLKQEKTTQKDGSYSPMTLLLGSKNLRSVGSAASLVYPYANKFRHELVHVCYHAKFESAFDVLPHIEPFHMVTVTLSEQEIVTSSWKWYQTAC